MGSELNENRFAKLVNNCLEMLDDYINGDEEITDEKKTKAHIATAMVSSFVRYKSQMAVVKVALINRLSENKEELAEYIRVSVPELQLNRALPIAEQVREVSRKLEEANQTIHTLRALNSQHLLESSKDSLAIPGEDSLNQK